ncbi:MAG TPA: acyl-CoA dehydrogenase family protein [Gammaproteobacteria bacterium]|nr:acyl-CoA dehydrogenase family protein [Gammaproteobacteria bacterium]
MEDFLFLQDDFTPEERLIRDEVRRFVDRDVIPIMADAYETAQFPQQFIPQCAALGLLSLKLPIEYGGSGRSAIAYGLVCQELERGDSALRSFISVQNALCMFPIFTFGSEAQKQKFLPKMAAGKLIGCFGLTEPDAGSDPSSLRTQAKKVSGGWLLNGVKRWVTNGTIADCAIIWAHTVEGIRGFIVEKDFPGCTRQEIKKKMSLRASISAELFFKDCFVPESHYLPGTEIGLVAALHCLTEARYGIAWGAIGSAMACYEIALDYCKKRMQFNRPLASFQLVQKDLVTMFLEIQKALCLNLQLGRLKERGQCTYPMVSLAKLNACREALKIARMARNLLGANGITSEYAVIRHMINLESVFTYEGTDNIHHLIVGKYITGLDAFC